MVLASKRALIGDVVHDQRVGPRGCEDGKMFQRLRMPRCLRPLAGFLIVLSHQSPLVQSTNHDASSRLRRPPL